VAESCRLGGAIYVSAIQNIENNPMHRKEPLENKRVAGMDALLAKTFDTSGKSPAHLHHRAICRTVADGAPSGDRIASRTPNHSGSGRPNRSPPKCFHRRVLLLLDCRDLGDSLTGRRTHRARPAQAGHAFFASFINAMIEAAYHGAPRGEAGKRFDGSVHRLGQAAIR
jgi:hypothetical protein